MTNKKENKKKKINNKEKTNYLDKFIPKTTTEIILVVSFITLLILVIILSFKAINLKKEFNRRQEMDFIMPVLDNKTNNSFEVDLTDMKKDDIKEYKFMITNYKDKNIAKEEISYQIELANNSDDVKIKLYKEKEDKNLLSEKEKVQKLENNSLTGNEKDSDTYYLIIRATDEVTKKDNISIKITSIN